jgi:hypothetical protein
MRAVRGCSWIVVAVGVATAGATAQPASGAGPRGLTTAAALHKVAAQRDPLAKPRLGTPWRTFGEQYRLARPSFRVLKGTRLAPGVCDFANRLTLAPHQRAIEGRARAINLSTCVAVVERGVPPAPAVPEQQRAGSTQAAAGPLDPLLDDLQENPGADIVDPNDPPGPPVDPHDVSVETDPPGVNTDAVPQPGVGAGAIQCAPGAGCVGTPEPPGTMSTRENGGYTAGYYRTWYEDPVGIDVAVDNTHINFEYTPGGCVKRLGFGGFADYTYYSTSGWELVAHNLKSGRVCGYAYESSFAYMKNTKFCRIFGFGFGHTTKVHFDRTTIRGLSSGGLHGLGHSIASGGCTKLLSFHDRIVLTAHDE